MNEREFVDDKLRDLADYCGSLRNPADRARTRFALFLGEALMRAHREVDDDVWQLREQLERYGNDLSAAMGHLDDSGDIYEPGVPAGMGDGGQILTERDLVDGALAKAKDILATESQVLGQAAMWMHIAYTLVEANVRQIRDLDDTVSNLGNSLIAHGAKVISAIPDFREGLKPPPEEKKKGWL